MINSEQLVQKERISEKRVVEGGELSDDGCHGEGL